MDRQIGVITTDRFGKEFLRVFMESVEIYPEKLDNGCILKLQLRQFVCSFVSLIYDALNTVDELKG